MTGLLQQKLGNGNGYAEMHILGETRRLTRELHFTEGPEGTLVTKALR